MKFVSLFPGIGGFDLGFERAGMKCVQQVEIDKDCQRVLAKHFPKVERIADVTTVRELPRVDVLCGGFPCQDLSVAGKRKGLAGERSGLWYEFLRIAATNQPRYVVIENVPGLLSSDGYRDFAVIIRGLVECGYCIAWRMLDAQFYGVAQRRRRLFIVGSLGDGSCAEILFERKSVSWNPPTRGETGPRVTKPVAASLTANYGKQLDNSDRNGGPPNLIARPLANSRTVDHYDESQQTYVVAGALRARRPGEGGVAGDDTHIIASSLMGHSGLHDSGGQQNFVIDPTPTAYRTAGNCGPFEQGGKTAALNTATDPNQNIIVFEPHHDEHEGRGANFKSTQTNPSLRGPNGTDNTLIAFDHCLQGSERTFIHRKNGQAQLQANRPDAVAGNFGVRRLTPRECERLQGFPDHWTLHDADGKEISDSARYRMLGNAVCVNVAEWLGKRLMQQV